MGWFGWKLGLVLVSEGFFRAGNWLLAEKHGSREGFLRRFGMLEGCFAWRWRRNRAIFLFSLPFWVVWGVFLIVLAEEIGLYRRFLRQFSYDSPALGPFWRRNLL